MVLRCTKKLLTLLHSANITVAEPRSSDDDWYANLLWHERRKCLLLVHAGTLFPVFVRDVRAADLRPLGPRIVALLEGALLEEGLPIDALGPLRAHDLQLAKTASRHVLGVMNEMAFECSWIINQSGGIANIDLDELNHHLRRSLHTKNREYRQPLDLVLERLNTRP